jgi:hypothetical protein
MRKVLLMVVMLMGIFAANAQLGHEQHKSGVVIPWRILSTS